MTSTTTEQTAALTGSTTIEWTEETWNPVNGCDKVSPGCKHCYAEVMAKRLQGMGMPGYDNGFDVTLNRNVLHNPQSWKKPRKVFVNSMGDLFHDEVPQEYRYKVFQVMNDCQRHQFQILTKRPEMLVEVQHEFQWTSNIWMGVSVELETYYHRIDLLRTCPAAVRFLSLEPLLGPLPDLDLTGIHWVIVGGESGPGARPMDTDWVLDIRDQCLAADVSFFFKQWGGRNKQATGRLLEGREWNQMPGHDAI